MENQKTINLKEAIVGKLDEFIAVYAQKSSKVLDAFSIFEPDELIPILKTNKYKDNPVVATMIDDLKEDPIVRDVRKEGQIIYNYLASKRFYR